MSGRNDYKQGEISAPSFVDYIRMLIYADFN